MMTSHFSSEAVSQALPSPVTASTSSGRPKYSREMSTIFRSISTPVTEQPGKYSRHCSAKVPVPRPSISTSSAFSAMSGAARA